MFKNRFKTAWQSIMRNHSHQLSFFSKLVVCLFLSTYKQLAGIAQVKPVKMDTFLDSKPFIDWAKHHAFPLESDDSATTSADLQPLKKIIGNARVVALGEPTHGLHELLVFRNRMFRFLAENCGFTTIILEANFSTSRYAADYIAGGPGTAEAASQKLTIGKPASENIELLQWMRKYNADTSHHHKLKFYGMDMEIQGFPGDTTPSHPALDEALNYLTAVDSTTAKKIASALKPYMNRLSVAKYPLLSLEEHDKLSAILSDMIALFESGRIKLISASSRERYEWAYQNAIVSQQTDRMVRVSPPDQPGQIPPEAWVAVSARDAAMAENVMWILNNEAEGGKVLVFAHNAHVKNAETVGSVWNVFAQPPNSTGQYLRSMLDRDLIIIGSSCFPSIATAQPGSLDSALSQVGKPRFILDLRKATSNGAVESWLAEKHPMEANKVAYLILQPNQAFNVLLFIDKMQ
jgi:erythromycin esterase